MLGDRTLHTARYFNVGSFATVIVASKIEGIDWAAYIGGADPAISEEEAVKYVAGYGRKLTERDARHFFPGFNDKPYRH